MMIGFFLNFILISPFKLKSSPFLKVFSHFIMCFKNFVNQEQTNQEADDSSDDVKA
jgi:hypothetical protein